MNATGETIKAPLGHSVAIQYNSPAINPASVKLIMFNLLRLRGADSTQRGISEAVVCAVVVLDCVIL